MIKLFSHLHFIQFVLKWLKGPNPYCGLIACSILLLKLKLFGNYRSTEAAKCLICSPDVVAVGCRGVCLSGPPGQGEPSWLGGKEGGMPPLPTQAIKAGMR